MMAPVRERPCSRSLPLAWALLATLIAAWPAGAGTTLLDLYRKPSLRQLEISPSGEHLASVVRQRNRDVVLVGRRDAPEPRVAFSRASEIRRILWLDDRHLVILVGQWSQPSYHVVIVTEENGGLATREERIRAPGRLVSALPDDAGRVLWAARERSETSVYRLALSDLLRETPGDLGASFAPSRVATLPGIVDRWVADREGTVRAALRLQAVGRSELWVRASAAAEWRRLVDAEDPEDMPHPLGVAENGRDLIVASARDRDTWALFELSVETGALGRELLAIEGADVKDVVYDYSGNVVIGAVYERDGLDEFHHFDAFFERYQQSLVHALPDSVVQMASVSRDRRYIVVVASGPRDPGTYYLLDTGTNTATRIGRTMPWLDPDRLAAVEALRVTSPGGAEVEAFLARPRSDGHGPPPLVVLAHGGPVGVRDTRSFDPLVQYLAAGGIAVLQVNYRGSSGRGRTFLDAGKRAWGKGIEDDLDAAVAEVVRRGWVDGGRICVAGGSYGGYSALMSVIRSPDRYRCAVSINAPTDLPFLYRSSAFLHATEEGREYFRDFIGDPEGGYDELLAISPAYRAAEIRAPVLLMHGSEDRRVDADHFYRVRAVLEALGRPHESFLIEGAGHVPTNDEWIEIASRLRAFLIRHLEPG